MPSQMVIAGDPHDLSLFAFYSFGEILNHSSKSHLQNLLRNRDEFKLSNNKIQD